MPPPGDVVVVPLGTSLDLLAIAEEPGLASPAVITVRGWQLLVADPVGELTSLEALDRYAEHAGWRDPAPDGPPFRGGAVGFLTDDLDSAFLGLAGDDRPRASQLPALHFTVHEWALAVDPAGQGWLIAPAEKIDDLRRVARYHDGGQPSVPVHTDALAHPGLSRAHHAAAVRQILEWIAAGDLYQANLTFQVRTPWEQPATALARALWQATPGAAHAALLTVDEDHAIVSASPETFLRVTGDRVVTRPIKGTRPRSRDAGADQAAAAALRGSAKDHAEHVMIVDLERNDLGRVCQPGSVVVESYADLEALPTVWHLTSTVAGRLRPEVGLADLLRATFPPGSVTGTPKRMAVARTRLVEPVRRGVYCGAVGLVGPGMLDLSVAIRTAVVSGGVASYGAGGGIVADSDADAEYAEALDKAAAFLTATGARLA